MPRNDLTFLNLHKKLINKKFKKEWSENTDNYHINNILSHASKSKNGNVGLPDFIYEDANKEMLILIELKSTINQHAKNAIPEIKHYLNCFDQKYMATISELTTKEKQSYEYLKNWNILGIAVSGDVLEDNGHLIDTFYLGINGIEDLKISEIHDEEDYEALFSNVDLEHISEKVSESAIKINNLLYNVKEDKRPTLLSILMISLFESENSINYFRNDYEKYEPCDIFSHMKINIEKILGEKGENLPKKKIEMILREIILFENESVLTKTDTIKTILRELKHNVIPLFETKRNYDIIGKFYQEFLRYAGIVDVQSGIVLTPEHVTELFCHLVDLKKDDIIFDSCCGTGSFLIAGMNKLIELQSTKQDKQLVKSNQIIGNELKSHMYILAISNMIFRGDGKSNLLNQDFFSNDFDEEFEQIIKKTGKPTIGFINPPYSGSFTDYNELVSFIKNPKRSKNKKPWMKEISFLKKMLGICSRYVVMIAPPQSYMSENVIRDMILKENSLKAVINMPKDLFEPNASTGSAIIIFETNRKHNYNNEVLFYNLEEDGFTLSKKKGRRDVYNLWNGIKKNLLKDLDAPYYRTPSNVDGYKLISTKIKKEDEWVFQAHSKINYDNLSSKDFERVVKESVIFNAKNNFGLISKDVDVVDMIDIFINIDSKPISLKKTTEKIDYDLFSLEEIFNVPVEHGERLVQKDRVPGDIPLITAGKYDNGIKEYILKTDTKAIYKDCFAVDMFGNAFYNNFEFVCDDNVYPLILKDIHINKIDSYNSIYLLTVLKYLSKDKFDYTRQLRKKRIENDEHIKLLLPIDLNGKINWEYMSEYIKTLPYSGAL